MLTRQQIEQFPVGTKVVMDDYRNTAEDSSYNGGNYSYKTIYKKYSSSEGEYWTPRYTSSAMYEMCPNCGFFVLGPGVCECKPKRLANHDMFNDLLVGVPHVYITVDVP